MVLSSRSRRNARVALLAASALLLLTGCGAGSSANSNGSASSPGSSDAATDATLGPGDSASPSEPPPAPPADFSGVQVAESIDGYDRPWDLRFLPDGTPLVTERPGRLAALVDGQRVVVADVPDVVALGEGGLMGLALDPDFTTNRRIYLCYAAGSGGAVRDVRVVRYRLAEGLDALTNPRPLVTGIPSGAGNRHLGCRLEVGPDGMLWTTTGDAVQPSAPQDPGSRAGKVLRSTLSGSPAPGNPFGSWDPYVYTLGHRNIQGLSFRASDDAAFTVEHGTRCDDEINLLAPAANFGWDPVGPGGSYAEDAPMTSPDVEGAVTAVWSSGCPTIAPSGAEFITGAQWGTWTGALAVAVLKDKELMLVDLDGSTVTGTRTELRDVLGRLRTVRNGPDGSLWVTVDATPGQVVQLKAVS